MIQKLPLTLRRDSLSFCQSGNTFPASCIYKNQTKNAPVDTLTCCEAMAYIKVTQKYVVCNIEYADSNRYKIMPLATMVEAQTAMAFTYPRQA